MGCIVGTVQLKKEMTAVSCAGRVIGRGTERNNSREVDSLLRKLLADGAVDRAAGREAE